ncbi:MAG: hypothetical protein OXL68_08995 [Paracoccaceae bacterium]|nr:hypothetical protein [Paracoccaceae bacterium]
MSSQTENSLSVAGECPDGLCHLVERRVDVEACHDPLDGRVQGEDAPAPPACGRQNRPIFIESSSKSQISYEHFTPIRPLIMHTLS